jgi:ElaB/YqjD/DUF883 family membrane-anchored ribosome-binding protein
LILKYRAEVRKMKESILKKALFDSLRRIWGEIQEGVRRAPEAHKLRMNEHLFPWAVIVKDAREAIKAIGLAKADFEGDQLPLEEMRQAFNEINIRWQELVTLLPSKDSFLVREIENCLNRLREELESGGARLPQESELPEEMRPLAPEILWWQRAHGVEACFHNIRFFSRKLLDVIRSTVGGDSGRRMEQLLEEIISECEKILPPLRELRRRAGEALERKKEAVKPKKTLEERLKEALDKVGRRLGALYYGFEEVDKRADEVNEAFKWLRTLVEAKGRVENIKAAMGRFARAWHEYAMKAPLPIGTFGPFPPRNRFVDDLNDDILELFEILNEVLKKWEAEETEPSALRKQFVGEKEEERQWLRKRALDTIRSAKFYLERLSEGMLEDIIHNRLRDIVSGVSVDLSDLSDNIEQARNLLVYLELQMEKEKPDTEMVNEICGRLEMLLQPLQARVRQVFEETKGQVEAARERIKLEFLGEHELKSIANVLYSLSEVVDEIPEYAKELRKPIRKPRAPKVKPRFGGLP